MKTINYINIIIVFTLALFTLSDSVMAGTITYNLQDDATGGQCNLIGTWVPGSKTCVLTGSVECESNDVGTLTCISIVDDGITLNCKDNSVFTNSATPTSLFNGIGINNLSGVTVKRCDISGFDTGILMSDSSNITIFYNNFSDLDIEAISMTVVSNSNIIGNSSDSSAQRLLDSAITKNNQAIGNSSAGATIDAIDISDCTNDVFISNCADNSSSSADGFNIFGCTRSEFINNSASGNSGNGFLFSGLDGARSSVFANKSTGNSLDGYQVESISSYDFEHNIADGNSVFGIDDDSLGNKTGGTANTYEGNTCDGNSTGDSDPTGLCN